MRAAVSLLCAGLLLAGCGSSRYQRPAVALPPTYRGDTQTPPTGARGLGELHWQDVIRDEGLARLIREALANNFDVQIAAARVLEARAQFGISRSALLPSVDAQASYNNLRVAENGSSHVPLGVSPDADYSNVSAGLGWELDLWGRLRNANRAARAALLAGEQERRAVLQSLVGDVASTYYLLLDLDQELEITKRALQLREDSFDLVKLRVDHGYSSEMDLRQAEVLVKSARASLTGLQLASEQAEDQLATLLGRNPGPIARGRSLLDQELTPGLPAGLPSTLLDRRPDIRAAEQRLIEEHALVAVAKTDFFPRISLTAATGFESSALRELFQQSNRTWFFGPPLSLPIFNAGRIRAGVRRRTGAPHPGPAGLPEDGATGVSRSGGLARRTPASDRTAHPTGRACRKPARGRGSRRPEISRRRRQLPGVSRFRTTVAGCAAPAGPDSPRRTDQRRHPVSCAGRRLAVIRFRTCIPRDIH